jgi:hypothetical protein
MADREKLEKRAGRVVFWQGLLNQSVDRTMRHIQTQGQPLPVQAGKAALALVDFSFNCVISVPGVVAAERFARTAQEFDAVRAPDPETYTDPRMRLASRILSTHLATPAGEVVSIDELATQVVNGDFPGSSTSAT